MPRAILTAAAAVARARQGDASLYAPLRPVLIGPRAHLHRFAVEAERAGLGAYDKLADQEYAYPDRSAGGVVDLASVRLYAVDADLNYFNKYVGSNGSCQPSSAHPNRVRAANYVFKTGNGYARSADFYDRDVKAGDVAYVRGTDGGEPVELTTTVTGFVGEPVAATTGAATADDNNADTQILAVAVTQVADTPINDVVATASAAAYESTADGYINRTYTVTVTQSSTGGDATTALLRVRSADGLDDQDDVSPAAFGAATAIGTKGLTVTWDIDTGNSSASLFGIDEDDLVVGQAWTVEVSQAFTAPTATSAGTYTGTQDTTYIVTVSRGGLYAGATKPQITVTTTTGYDQSGPTSVTAAASAVAVGSYGVTVAFNQTRLRKGDVYYVVVAAAAEGQLRTLVLQHDVPAAIRVTEVDLRLFARRSAVEIPAVRTTPTETTNWTATATDLTVESGIRLLDGEFTDGGDAVPVALDAATLYVEYREWAAAPDDEIEVVELAAVDAVAAALGTVDPDNPIAYAAAKALGMTDGELSGDPARPMATTTDRVLCVAIGGDPADTALWEAALELVEGTDDAYALVPLSADTAVHALFAAHVVAQSADAVGLYRVAWIPAAAAATGAVQAAATSGDGGVITATIGATPATSPTAYTTVTASANARFVTAAVRAGDTLRINFGTDAFGAETYDEYAVASVTSESTLVLAAGPDAAVSPARRVEVWRTYTKAELVTRLTAAAAAYGTERVRYVWPDAPGYGGTTLPGYVGCAIAAGLTGSVPSHQGVRNVSLAGVDDLTRSSRFFTGTQLDALAAGGVFVLSQTPGGTPYVRNAVTTDPSTAATREETIVRNADMIRKAVQTEWAPYVGSGNVISNLQELLAAALASLVGRLKAAGNVEALGPPLADLTLVSVEAVPGDATAVTATLSVTGIAVPLNQIRVVLPVTV